MELWDGYNRDGTLSGRDLVRGEPIPPGLYHLVCDILVRHRDGGYLLMLRDPRKPNYGGWCEATAGGSALKGEAGLTCARRELWEETGIASGSFRKIGCYISHNTIYYQYLCIMDCEKSSVRFQEGETVGCKWVSKTEFIDFVNSEAMIDVQKERYRPYFEKTGCSKRHTE